MSHRYRESRASTFGSFYSSPASIPSSTIRYNNRTDSIADSLPIYTNIAACDAYDRRARDMRTVGRAAPPDNAGCSTTGSNARPWRQDIPKPIDRTPTYADDEDEEESDDDSFSSRRRSTSEAGCWPWSRTKTYSGSDKARKPSRLARLKKALCGAEARPCSPTESVESMPSPDPKPAPRPRPPQQVPVGTRRGAFPHGPSPLSRPPISACYDDSIPEMAFSTRRTASCPIATTPSAYSQGTRRIYQTVSGAEARTTGLRKPLEPHQRGNPGGYSRPRGNDS
ncbi:hypothetical protein HIM_00960 [Hirsutella minnesotensis 3608]|nr:hypothetical protein HIM_00960 [Hirsutella minnesotensis 3608]